MTGIPPTGLKVATKAAAKAAEEELEHAVRTAVQDHSKGATLTHAMNVAPAPRARRLTELYALLTGATTASRAKAVRSVVGRLRTELSAVFATIPLTPAHFGFRNLDEFTEFVGKALAKAGTGARTRGEFVAGIAGWRWNLAGLVLFERLVKHHPQLQKFFAGMAEDWGRTINGASRELVNLAGNRVSAVGTFDRPRRVEYFEIIGADGVTRASADFGFLATDGNRFALLPIEIKMPAALSGVAGQFSEFVPRLADGQKLIAYVSEGRGVNKAAEPIKIEIDPGKLVFLKNDGAQVAVAPYGKKRFEEKFGSKKISPDDVASIDALDQGVSPSRDVVYYRARLMVKSSWLASIVEAVTDPPGK